MQFNLLHCCLFLNQKPSLHLAFIFLPVIISYSTCYRLALDMWSHGASGRREVWWGIATVAAVAGVTLAERDATGLHGGIAAAVLVERPLRLVNLPQQKIVRRWIDEGPKCLGHIVRYHKKDRYDQNRQPEEWMVQRQRNNIEPVHGRKEAVQPYEQEVTTEGKPPNCPENVIRRHGHGHDLILHGNDDARIHEQSPAIQTQLRPPRHGVQPRAIHVEIEISATREDPCGSTHKACANAEEKQSLNECEDAPPSHVLDVQHLAKTARSVCLARESHYLRSRHIEVHGPEG